MPLVSCIGASHQSALKALATIFLRACFSTGVFSSRMALLCFKILPAIVCEINLPESSSFKCLLDYELKLNIVSHLKACHWGALCENCRT